MREVGTSVSVCMGDHSSREAYSGTFPRGEQPWAGSGKADSLLPGGVCDEQQADHDAALDSQFQELQITAGRHGDELKTSRMEISELNLTIQEVYASWRQDLPVEHKLHPAQQGRKLPSFPSCASSQIIFPSLPLS